MHAVQYGRNIAPQNSIFGSRKANAISDLVEWVSDDGKPYALTLTPNDMAGRRTDLLSKLKRLSAELAHGPRNVPRSCPLSNMTRDRPRIAGFIEAQTTTTATITHFHGLIGLRSGTEVALCRQFLDDHWCGLRDPLKEAVRSYKLDDCANNEFGPKGWLRYSTKYQGLGFPSEVIIIG